MVTTFLIWLAFVSVCYVRGIVEERKLNLRDWDYSARNDFGYAVVCSGSVAALLAFAVALAQGAMI